jgi:CHAD domain-containing protein
VSQPGKLTLSGDLPLNQAVARSLSSVVEHAASMAAVARRQPTRAVHEWRKSLRRARSVLRLARPALDDRIYRSLNTSLGNAQRAASSLRDAEALLLALRWLRPERGQTAAERRDITPFSRSLRGRLAPAARPPARWRRTGPASRRPPTFRAGAAARARLARSSRGCATATTGPAGPCAPAPPRTTSDFHDLRKAIKALHYQAELLASTGHRPATKLRKRLDELAETQGHVTDLLLLRAHAPDLPALRSLISRTIPPHRKAAVKQARRVLHGSSKAFAKKLVPK